MSHVKINKDDNNRVLLTELLPYEVPMLFSNDGFYTLITEDRHKGFFNKIKSLRKSGKYGIPFNYDIKKSVEGEVRTLSIMHPLNQFDFIDFYAKYNSLIIHLCSKSTFSLRRVTKVAKFYYSPDLVFDDNTHKDDDVEVEPEFLDREIPVLKSYFTYEPIDLIYKFYDRHEYQRLEQRFDFLMEFDINKCFYNIYTHSICWAIKGKEIAKRNSRKFSFENDFDKIMQHSNYDETNGILVGPEVSRIFAEIILQQIDINVLKRLEEEKIKIGIDYEIRRYVDDFFVFSNDTNILDIILKTYKKELNYYKLYINNSKTEKRSTPFLTNIAVGKHELRTLLNQLSDRVISTSEEKENDGLEVGIKNLNLIRNPYGVSQSFIKDFQCIVKRNNLTYDILSKEIVRHIKKLVTDSFKISPVTTDKKVMENYLLLVLDIVFYAYSLNITSSTTFKLAQTLVIICKYLDKKDEEMRHIIFSKIIKDSDFVMTNFQRKIKNNETNVETLNLLIALKKLDKTYIFNEKKIRELFDLKEKDDFKKLNYFHIITLLYYIDDNVEFNFIKSNIELTTIDRFKTEDDPFTKAELTLLFFDFVCCPFVSMSSKRKVLIESHYAKTNLDQEISLIGSCGKWFMDWDIDIDLERVLKKKEWGSSY